MKILIRRVSLECLAEMFQNLGFLDLAGVSLEEALATISQAPPHRRLKIPLQRIQAGMQSGLLLSEALAQQPTMFSKLIIQIIAVGEKTGKLAPYFQDTESHLRWQISLQTTITKTLRYGVMMLTLIVAMILAVTIFLLPQIEGLLLSIGVAQLPMATRSLLLFGKYFESVGILVLLVLPILILIAWRYQPAALRHIPVLGPLLIAKNMTYYLKTCAALLQAHVDLLPALEQAQTAVTFPYLAKHLARIPASIAAGATLSQSLVAQPHFPPLAIRLIHLGENTGRLPTLVSQAAAQHQQTHAKKVERLVATLHPALVMILGLLILWIVLATLLPLYNHLDGMG